MSATSGETATLIVLSIGIGIGVAFGVFRVLAATVLPHSTSVLEPLLTAVGLIVLVGCLAAFVPTMRAIRTNAVDAFRVE